MYQVWDKDNIDNRNDERVVVRITAKEWVNLYKLINENLSKNNQPLFTPTTIIETEDGEQYACVINKVFYNKKDQIVFRVSTKEIKLGNNCSKKLIDIPCGYFTNMRFDIDESFNYAASGACLGGLIGIICGWLFMQ